MAKVISNPTVQLGGNVAPFVAGFQRAGAAAEQLMTTLGSTAASVLKVTGAMTVVGIGMRAVENVFGSLTESISLAATLEQNAVAFETMTGSATVAAKLMQQLNGFAASTPFQFPELATSSKMLLAFGVSVDQIIPSLKMLGDIASGVGAPLEDLARAYGKVKTAGRLTGETLDQFNSKGIPLLATLAKQLGVTTAEVTKMITAGQIGFPQVQKALAGLVGPGGQFAGMMEKQAGTLAGLWSTLTDNVSLSLASLTQKIIDTFSIKAGLSVLIDATGTAGAYVQAAVARWAPTILSAGQMVYSAVATVVTGIGQRAAGLYAAIAPPITTAFNYIASFAPAIGSAIATAFNAVYQPVAQVGKILYDLITPIVSVWTQGQNVVNTINVLAGVAATVAAGYVAWNIATVAIAASHTAAGIAMAAYSIVATGVVTASGLVATAQWAIATAGAAVKAVLIATHVALSAWTAASLGAAAATAIVTAGQWLYAAAVTAGQTIVATFTAMLSAGSIASAAWTAVTATATAAQWLLNAALTANPIGIVVVAVGALAVGLGVLAAKFIDVSATVAWLKNAMTVATYAVTHWQDTLKLAAVNVALFAVKTASQLTWAFTEVVPAVLTWFGNNWRNVFRDIGNFTATVFDNLLNNAAKFGEALWDAIKGKGFSFEWTPLTEGFKSAVKELPKIAEREIGPLESRLGKQAEDLARKFQQGLAGGVVQGNGDDMAKDVAEFFDDAVQDAVKSMKPPELPAPVVPKIDPLKIDASGATKPLDDVAKKAKDAQKGLDAVVSGSAESMRLAYQPVTAKASKQAAAVNSGIGAFAGDHQLVNPFQQFRADASWMKDTGFGNITKQGPATPTTPPTADASGTIAAPGTAPQTGGQIAGPGGAVSAMPVMDSAAPVPANALTKATAPIVSTPSDAASLDLDRARNMLLQQVLAELRKSPGSKPPVKV